MKYSLIHIPTLKKLNMFNNGTHFGEVERAFVMQEYLQEGYKIYMSVWVDNEDEFLLSNQRLLDRDILVDTCEFMWVENEI